MILESDLFVIRLDVLDVRFDVFDSFVLLYFDFLAMVFVGHLEFYVKVLIELMSQNILFVLELGF